MREFVTSVADRRVDARSAFADPDVAVLDRWVPRLCLVAEADGRVVGFMLGDETFEFIEDTAHIEWIAVDDEYRRHGIARRLLQEAVGAVERLGKRAVVADIASDNPYSRGLAEKLGFSEGLSVTYFTKRLR